MKKGLEVISTTHKARFFAALLASGAWLVLSGCGAPLKTANAVSEKFSETKTLDAKVNVLCQYLAASTELPNSHGLPLASGMCASSASNAVEMKKAALAPGEKLGFAEVKIKSEAVTNYDGELKNMLNIQTRTEAWLNRPLLDLLADVLPALRDKTTKSETTAAPDNEEFDMEIKSEPVFDKENWHFHLEIAITSDRTQNGFLTIKNDFRIDGQLIDKEFLAITIETIGNRTLAESLIENAKILVILVPQAQDVYLDIITNLNLYSFGPGVDKIMQARIMRVISDAINKIPDFLNNIEKEG